MRDVNSGGASVLAAGAVEARVGAVEGGERDDRENDDEWDESGHAPSMRRP
jgi:hypothetical protein